MYDSPETRVSIHNFLEGSDFARSAPWLDTSAFVVAHILRELLGRTPLGVLSSGSHVELRVGSRKILFTLQSPRKERLFRKAIPAKYFVRGWDEGGVGAEELINSIDQLFEAV